MKRIEKRAEPLVLRQWKKKNEKFPDAWYRSHRFPVQEVNESLVDEQGCICAYTMIRITPETSHNEHLKPQTVSKSEVPPKYSETTDYYNLVACYPNTGNLKHKCPYGADGRGDAWNPDLMITPLMGNCESLFSFSANGEVSPANAGDAAAEWTIATLRLDHADLKTLRRQAIVNERLTPTHPGALTAAQAKELAESICQRSRHGQFPPFCVAIKQVALEYAEKLEKRKQQREFARRSKSGKGKKK